MFNMNTNLSSVHPGYLVAMVVAFVAWWPLGVMVLAYIIWSGSMTRINGQWWERVKAFVSGQSFSGSGNAAFDAHREAMLRGLEEQRKRMEQDARDFALYMDKVRMARDEQSFNDFINQRRKA